MSVPGAAGSIREAYRPLPATARRGAALLAEFSALDPGPTEQLAMLFLGHALAPLLDY
jgi:hypothetical protein